MVRVSGESKSRLVKAAGAESCGQRRNQKLQAAVARRAFSSQNELTVSEHFLKFRCRKIARRCCKKHISSSENVQTKSFSDHFLKFLEVPREVGKCCAVFLKFLEKSRNAVFFQ